MNENGNSQAAKQITRGSCLCGATHWEFRGKIPDATSCNCTACRRYGTLWAYDYEGERISVYDASRNLVPYLRGSKVLSFNFCKVCGNVVSWRSATTGEDGRVRIAVNLRLAEPEDVADIPVLRFDGLHSFEDVLVDGRTVGDVWF